MQSNAGWELIADPASPRMRIGGEEVFFVADFPTASQGKWTHIAVGYHEMGSEGQDRTRVWVNGEPVLTESRVFGQSEVSPDGQLRIGLGGGGTQPFSGHLDEIRVYNALLEDAQVEALYLVNAPAP
jgi:hypothetical protein